jgi:hypothetical protein
MYEYDLLIKSVQQGTYPSSGGANRPQASADDAPEVVPAPLDQPTRPSDARVHRVGGPGRLLDESSARALHVGCGADEPVQLATIHQAGTHHGAQPADVALSRLTGVATA